jgi:hypothetical protein
VNDEVNAAIEQSCRAVGLVSPHTSLWVAARTLVSQLDRHGYEIRSKTEAKETS